MSKCQESQPSDHEAFYSVASFADDVPVSSVQQVVMVADDHVTMLVDDGPCTAPATDLNNEHSSEPFVTPFAEETDCLDSTAAGHEYAEDELHQDSLCMMADVADSSYEDKEMIRMGGVSVVCDGQTEESECSDVNELSTHSDLVLDTNACEQNDGEIPVLENIEIGTSIDEDGGQEEETSRALEPMLLDGTSGSIYQMVTNADGTVALVGLDPSQLEQLFHVQGEASETDAAGLRLMQIRTVNLDSSAVQTTSHQATRQLPPDCPSWATGLNDCERVGNSFRGWVETEAELDHILTCYKQTTHTYWGTRQSPCPSMKTSRFMWKSQYVPFDGIPFINIGSRAVVLECQFGPRRKNHTRKTTKASLNADTGSPVTGFRHSCPARIYVKKVRKFLDCAVDITQDKKQLKIDMDLAFQSIKDCYADRLGHDRLYVQLPTAAAHEYHLDSVEDYVSAETETASSSRLHPSVAQKIREIVSGGELRQYYVRYLLRRYVEKELSFEIGRLPEKHDLSYYPTVHDLQNNIHKALEDIKDGTLPFTSNPVTAAALTEKVTTSSGDSLTALNTEPSSSSWLPESTAAETVEESVPPAAPLAKVEAVTLMLTVQTEGQNMVSRVEVKMSDGKTHVSSTIPPDIAHIVSMMPPEMFAPTKLSVPAQNVDNGGGFDEVPSASLKDDGYVLLCNLSEPEVEEASPVTTNCDEPQCLVPAESDNALSVGHGTSEVECCGNTESQTDLPADDEHRISEHTSALSPVLRTCDRKRQSSSQGLGAPSRRKQKMHWKV